MHCENQILWIYDFEFAINQKIWKLEINTKL
jgi:hypothetical protein